MGSSWNLSSLPFETEIETKAVLKKLTRAGRALAEFLNALADGGSVVKHKIGNTNYYINIRLLKALTLADEN